MNSFFGKPTVIVFLKNKLISADAFLPLALELKSEMPGLDFIFYTFSREAQATLEKNSFLYQALLSLGPVKCKGRSSNQFIKKLFQQAYFLLWLMTICFKRFFCRNILVSFVSSLGWPLSMVVRASPQSSIVVDASQLGFLISDIIYSRTHSWYRPQSADVAVSELTRRLSSSSQKKNHSSPTITKNLLTGTGVALTKKTASSATNVLEDATNCKSTRICKEQAQKIQHRLLVSENPDSVIFSDPIFDNTQKLVIHSPKTLPVWFNCIETTGQKFFEEELLQVGHVEKENETFTIFLGVTGQHGAMKEGVKQIDLLEETISSIKRYFPDALVFLKPHAITNISDVENLIKIQGWNGVFITFLHPSILSKKSSLIFSNHFTTAFLDAKVFGKKTILYTDFSKKTLQSTGFKAPREEIVDIFISGNKHELDKLIQEEKETGPNSGKPIIHYGVNEHKSLINALKEILGLAPK
jgi:hypothetical protein